MICAVAPGGGRPRSCPFINLHDKSKMDFCTEQLEPRGEEFYTPPRRRLRRISNQVPNFQRRVRSRRDTALAGVPRVIFSEEIIWGEAAPGGNRYHCEKARGTCEQNVTYVRKTGEGQVPNEVVVEFGNPGRQRQGQRTDLMRIRDQIADGIPEAEIADEFFGQWVRYRQSFSAYRTLINRQVSTSTFPISTFPEAWRSIAFTNKCLILWGPLI